MLTLVIPELKETTWKKFGKDVTGVIVKIEL